MPGLLVGEWPSITKRLLGRQPSELGAVSDALSKAAVSQPVLATCCGVPRRFPPPWLPAGQRSVLLAAEEAAAHWGAAACTAARCYPVYQANSTWWMLGAGKSC